MPHTSHNQHSEVNNSSSPVALPEPDRRSVEDNGKADSGDVSKDLGSKDVPSFKDRLLDSLEIKSRLKEVEDEDVLEASHGKSDTGHSSKDLGSNDEQSFKDRLLDSLEIKPSLTEVEDEDVLEASDGKSDTGDSSKDIGSNKVAGFKDRLLDLLAIKSSLREVEEVPEESDWKAEVSENFGSKEVPEDRIVDGEEINSEFNEGFVEERDAGMLGSFKQESYTEDREQDALEEASIAEEELNEISAIEKDSFDLEDVKKMDGDPSEDLSEVVHHVSDENLAIDSEEIAADEEFFYLAEDDAEAVGTSIEPTRSIEEEEEETVDNSNEKKAESSQKQEDSIQVEVSNDIFQNSSAETSTENSALGNELPGSIEQQVNIVKVQGEESEEKSWENQKESVQEETSNSVPKTARKNSTNLERIRSTKQLVTEKGGEGENMEEFTQEEASQKNLLFSRAATVNVFEQEGFVHWSASNNSSGEIEGKFGEENEPSEEHKENKEYISEEIRKTSDDETSKKRERKRGTVDRRESEVLMEHSIENMEKELNEDPQPVLNAKRPVLERAEAFNDSTDEKSLDVVSSTEEVRSAKKIIEVLNEEIDDLAVIDAEEVDTNKLTRIQKRVIEISEEDMQKMLRFEKIKPPKRALSSPSISKTPQTPGVSVSSEPFTYLSEADILKMGGKFKVNVAEISRDSFQLESAESFENIELEEEEVKPPPPPPRKTKIESSSVVVTQPSVRETTRVVTPPSNLSERTEKKDYSWKSWAIWKICGCFNE